MLEYDIRSGQYRSKETGRYVSRSVVLSEVGNENDRLKVRLAGHARVFITGKIDLREFQVRIAEDLKASGIRMAALASGGTKRIGRDRYLAIGRELQDQYRRLAKFGRAIADGKLTEKQIIQRARQYSNSSTKIFYDAEKRAKISSGFNAAKRELDPQAIHCASCLRYSTNGKFFPVEQVVAPGTGCECRGNCRCRIVYRFIPFVGVRVSSLEGMVS